MALSPAFLHQALLHGLFSQTKTKKQCTFFHRVTTYQHNLAIRRIKRLWEEIHAVCYGVSR